MLLFLGDFYSRSVAGNRYSGFFSLHPLPLASLPPPVPDKRCQRMVFCSSLNSAMAYPLKGVLMQSSRNLMPTICSALGYEALFLLEGSRFAVTSWTISTQAMEMLHSQWHGVISWGYQRVFYHWWEKMTCWNMLRICMGATVTMFLIQYYALFRFYFLL